MSDRIEQIDAYLDGELDQAEAKELRAWINADPSNARQFADRALLQHEVRSILKRDRMLTVQSPRQVLQELLEHETNAEADLVHLHTIRNGPFDQARDVAALLFKPQVIAGIAAALVVAVSLFLVFQGGGDDPINDGLDPIAEQPDRPDAQPLPSVVATLTAEHNAVWAEGASARGSSLRAGQRLVLTQGFAEITTNRGAVAILEAPATIELLNNDNAVHLHAGRLVGICETETSKGFLVRTPHMDVVDLGTRFGVDTARDEATEVHVFEGEVEVMLPVSGQASTATRKRLVANQAVRTESGRDTLVTVAPDVQAFRIQPEVFVLRGTGYGLAERAADPNWLIVADASGPLDTPLPVTVVPEENRHQLVGNDPAKAQWLLAHPDRPGGGNHDVDSREYTFASEVVVPDNVAIDGQAVLYIKYSTDNGLKQLRINGQAIADLPVYSRRVDDVRTFNEVEVPLQTTALRQGSNQIEYQVLNSETTPCVFYLYWEIRQEAPLDKD